MYPNPVTPSKQSSSHPLEKGLYLTAAGEEVEFAEVGAAIIVVVESMMDRSAVRIGRWPVSL